MTDLDNELLYNQNEHDTSMGLGSISNQGGGFNNHNMLLHPSSHNHHNPHNNKSNNSDYFAQSPGGAGDFNHPQQS